MDGNSDRQHIRATNTTAVTVYSPAPMARPNSPHDHSPTEVVKPLIWLLELNSMEFALRMAIATTDAAEMRYIPLSVSSIIYTSSIIATVAVSDTSMKVRSPAA